MSRPEEWVLATHNPHKVQEFADLFHRVMPGVTIRGYHGPEPVEDGVTFAENALIKARAAHQHTGLPALADDSGLCVDVLGGAPGVFSAYWAGHAKDTTANRDLLLDQLADIRDPHRAAQFVSVIAVVHAGDEQVVRGQWRGRVARASSGEGGFGYDPVFIPDDQPAGQERTAAQLSFAEKNAHSHRAQAFEALVPVLRSSRLSGSR